MFLDSAKEHGNTISGALTQAGLPGFSQHHTGKDLDISSRVSPKILQKHNFTLPYPTETPFRMAEPWHIYSTS